MQYEISEEDFRVLRGACAVAYMAMAQETNNVVSAEMGMIRDACNRLETQHDEAEKAQSESAAEDVPQGQGLLVLGD